MAVEEAGIEDSFNFFVSLASAWLSLLLLFPLRLLIPIVVDTIDLRGRFDPFPTRASLYDVAAPFEGTADIPFSPPVVIVVPFVALP